jgi:archaellum component FlaC
MDTQYVIYEIISNDNNVLNIKIRYLCDNINDAENKFNRLKEIIPNIFMDTTTNFHSKFSIQY